MIRAEHLDPDDNAGQSHDNGSRSGGDLKKSFVLAVDGAGQGGEAVGDGQSCDLYGPLVFGQGGYQSLIVSHGPKKEAGSGVQIQIQKEFARQDNQQQDQDNRKRAQIGRDQAVNGRIFENGLLVENRHIGPSAGKAQVKGVEPRHDDDAGQKIPDL